MRVVRNLFRVGAAMALLTGLAVCSGVMPANPPSVEELKARLNSVSVADRPQLCVQIAERELDATDKLYAAIETEKAQAMLADVVVFSEEARDFAIQSHKHQKQIEIAARRMTRKLNDIKRTVSREEQAPLDNAINHLQRVRDDLLMAMFPKGAK